MANAERITGSRSRGSLTSRAFDNLNLTPAGDPATLTRRAHPRQSFPIRKGSSLGARFERLRFAPPPDGSWSPEWRHRRNQALSS